MLSFRIKKLVVVLMVISLSFIISACSIASDLKSASIRLVVSHESNSSFGSAVIYDQDDDYYYALTNQHVIQNALSVDGLDYQNNVYDVEIVMSDATIDLALIRFEKQIDLMVLSLASEITLDEVVYAVGYPDSIYTKTKGVINAIGFIDYDIQTKAITHTAEIDHGSSGGVLVNADNEIIGINFAASFDNVGFVESYAIPLETIKIFINV